MLEHNQAPELRLSKFHDVPFSRSINASNERADTAPCPTALIMHTEQAMMPQTGAKDMCCPSTILITGANCLGETLNACPGFAVHSLDQLDPREDSMRCQISLAQLTDLQACKAARP